MLFQDEFHHILSSQYIIFLTFSVIYDVPEAWTFTQLWKTNSLSKCLLTNPLDKQMYLRSDKFIWAKRKQIGREKKHISKAYNFGDSVVEWLAWSLITHGCQGSWVLITGRIYSFISWRAWRGIMKEERFVKETSGLQTTLNVVRLGTFQ